LLRKLLGQRPGAREEIGRRTTSRVRRDVAVRSPSIRRWYAMSMKLIDLVIELVCSPISRVALPMLSERQQDQPAFEASFVRLTTGAVLIGVPSLVGLALVAPEAVDTALGTGWQGSATVIRVLLGYGLVRVLFTLYDPAMLAKGRAAFASCRAKGHPTT